MNQDNSNSKSKKSLNQNNNLKLKIMDKYNVSSEEADKILLALMKKKIDEKISDTPNTVEINKKMTQDNIKTANLPNVIEDNEYDNNSDYDAKNDSILQYSNTQKLFGVSDKKYPMKNSNNHMNLDGKHENHTISNESEDFNKQDNNKDKNVDSILERIIPEYDKQISIKLENVDLTFEVQNEKIDTLKETFIRTLKRDKSKKIKIHALKNISFQIYKGEKIGIVGYNGAGKSTLLNVITGIFPPDKGTVTTYGTISPLLSLGAGFDPNFSGRHNIILNGAVLGYDKDYLESKIDEIIEFSELGEYIDIPIKNYSSGMLAKLGFSIATAVNPDILIIDEILGVGDVNFRKKSTDKIKSLMDGGTTVLFVSHSIIQVRDLCDKAIWIDNGKIRDIGDVNKVCDNYLKDAENASKAQLANIKLFK